MGGAGGIDSQIVAFRASPNEDVHITKPGQGLSDGHGPTGRVTVEVAASEDLVVRVAEAGAAAGVEVVQRETPKAVNSGMAKGQFDMALRNRYNLSARPLR